MSELYVKPRHRKKGVATKLIRRLFRIRLPSFVKRLTVTALPKATGVIQLYEKLGFRIRGKTRAGNIKLEKEL